jgi:hypothetical protein
MKQLFGVFIICFFFYGCSDKEKKDSSILSEKQMTDVMWDLMRADQFVQDFVMKDSTKNKKEESLRLYEEIFRMHHTTAEQFKKSQAYYQSNPLLFRPIIDSLAKKQPIVAYPVRSLAPDSNFQHQPGKQPPPKAILKE